MSRSEYKKSRPLRHVKQGIQDLATRVGVELSGRKCNYPYEFPWDGKTIATNDSTGYIGTNVILHEIAHWAIADPERRQLANFGLYMEHKLEENEAQELEKIYKEEID